MKVGRNDPCPCGSGKKYKKCCLEKDEQERSEEIPHIRDVPKVPDEYHIKPDVDEWEYEEREEQFDEDSDDDWDDDWDDDPDMYDDDDFDEDYEEEDSDDEIPQINVEPLEEGELERESEEEADDELEFPELSVEDNKLIDDWWQIYIPMEDAVIEREHLVTFMQQYPHLVNYLGLEDEVLFDLGARHYRDGIYEIFVELLLRIRKEYPETYIKSFGWYDYDMICWTMAQGRVEDIHPFFDFFKQDVTGEYDNKLENLISFFRATNHSDILLTEFTDNRCSRYIRQVIVNDVMSKYFDQPITQESVHSLMEELLSKGVKLNQQNEGEVWREKWLRHIRPFTEWDTNLPMKRSDAMKKYLEITDNFAYFLYQNTGLSFDSAGYYSDTVYEYYQKVVSKLKRPENIFCLDMKTFDENSMKQNRFFVQNDIDYFAQVNAFYHYATYLNTCGNITEEKQLEFQEQMSETYWNFYSRVKNFGPEMLLFDRFPLFRV